MMPLVGVPRPATGLDAFCLRHFSTQNVTNGHFAKLLPSRNTILAPSCRGCGSREADVLLFNGVSQNHAVALTMPTS